MNLKSLYICVQDMNRAIEFYEELLDQTVTEKDVNLMSMVVTVCQA